MAERPQAQLALHELQRPHVAVDEIREELRARVPRPDVPVDGVHEVRRQVEHVGLVVLAEHEARRPRLGAPLHRLIDDEARWIAPQLPMREGVGPSGAKPQTSGQIVEEVPLRLEPEHAIEQLVRSSFVYQST